MTSFWIQMLVGGVVGLGVSLGLIRFLAPRGWMDRPDEARKTHSRPVPRTGGMALWVVVALVQLSGALSGYLNAVDWAGIHLMALLGVMDDRFDVRARYKALLGMAVALLLAIHTTKTLGVTATEVSFLGMDVPGHPKVILPILTLWFWAVPQAYNLIDGINGLSMGIACLLLGVLGWNLGVQPALLWGGLAAAFVLNFPKAHHFLGDCGALMLGTLFAIMGVKAFALRDPNLLLWAFAYPSVDVSLVVCIRRWKGKPLGEADRSHLHHWMMDRVGGRAWVATPLLLGLAFLPMVRALAFPGHLAVSVFGLVTLGVLAFKVFKDRVTEPQSSKVQAQVRRAIPAMLPSGIREASGSHAKL